MNEKMQVCVVGYEWMRVSYEWMKKYKFLLKYVCEDLVVRYSIRKKKWKWNEIYHDQMKEKKCYLSEIWRWWYVAWLFQVLCGFHEEMRHQKVMFVGKKRKKIMLLSWETSKENDGFSNIFVSHSFSLLCELISNKTFEREISRHFVMYQSSIHLVNGVTIYIVSLGFLYFYNANNALVEWF